MADTAAIRRAIERYAGGLARLADRLIATILEGYQDARRALRESLETVTTPTSNVTALQLQMALHRVELDLQQLTLRLYGQADTTALQIGEHVAEEVTGVLAAADENPVSLVAPMQGQMARARQQLHHRLHMQRYIQELRGRIQAALVSAQITKLPASRLVRQIAGPADSIFTAFQARLELMTRMELMRAYDAQHQAAMEAATTLDPTLLVRADETLDGRNHPFSRVLDGMVRPVKGEWRVPIAQVQAEAMRMGRSDRGIFWRIEDGHYVGSTFPAHYGDRGRQIPWRASWGEDMRGGAAGERWKKDKQGILSREDPTIEKQLHDMACGAACAVMLARDRGIAVEQAPLAARILRSDQLSPELILFGGIEAYELAQMMSEQTGRIWAGGGFGINPVDVDKWIQGLCKSGSWAALIGPRSAGHWVVVDRLDEQQFVHIRDPSGHERRIPLQVFANIWHPNYIGVLERP